MPDSNPQPAQSIWTREIPLPHWLALPVRFARFILLVLTVVGLVLLTVVVGLRVYDSWVFRPGASLKLTESAAIRVPDGFDAHEYVDRADTTTLRTYVLNDSSVERGGELWVRVLSTGALPSYEDPAAVAQSLRKNGRQVGGPVTFNYHGHQVTAIVHSTYTRGTHEGPATLMMLVELNGQLLAVSGDNQVVGTPEDADPQRMATAALDRLRLVAQ